MDLVTLSAGAIAGIVSDVALFPLDTIKTRLYVCTPAHPHSPIAGHTHSIHLALQPGSRGLRARGWAARSVPRSGRHSARLGALCRSVLPRLRASKTHSRSGGSKYSSRSGTRRRRIHWRDGILQSYVGSQADVSQSWHRLRLCFACLVRLLNSECKLHCPATAPCPQLCRVCSQRRACAASTAAWASHSSEISPSHSCSSLCTSSSSEG